MKRISDNSNALCAIGKSLAVLSKHALIGIEPIKSAIKRISMVTEQQELEKRREEFEKANLAFDTSSKNTSLVNFVGCQAITIKPLNRGNLL